MKGNIKKYIKEHIGYIIIILFFIIYFVGSAVYYRDKYSKIYDEGVILLESGNYEEAVEKFNEIPNCEAYKDVGELLEIERICSECGAIRY